MDGNFFLLILFWVANNAFMYRIGFTRALAEALKLAEDMHAPLDSGDGAYWKKMYEDLAAEGERFTAAVKEEIKDAPGETT